MEFNLNNLKIPRIKFKRIKMDSVGDLEDLKIDPENMKPEPIKKRTEPYEHTNYKTVKEFFYRACELYPEEDCILEKPDRKVPYHVTTYREFEEDVVAYGTALLRILNQKNKRVIIIGETQYDWYLSYMALLCGGILAVPVDRELPDNELENIIKRSKASMVIYSQRKADSIKKIRDNVSEVEYFVEMKSDKPLSGKEMGTKALLEMGRKIVQSGDDSFKQIEIDPEAFKVLIFTSGTTSNSKGVMLCNRNLAENINAITAYVRLYPTDRLFSVLPLHHTYESTIGFLYPISQGASVAVCQGLRYIVSDMQEAKPTAVLVVPLLVETIYKRINETIRKSHKEKLVASLMGITNRWKFKDHCFSSSTGG